MLDYLQRAPFVRIVLPFIAGIAVTPVFAGFPGWLFPAVTCTVYILLLFTVHAGYYRHVATGICFTLFFLLAGICLTQSGNKPSGRLLPGKYRAVLLEKPVEKARSLKAEALITGVFSEDTLFQTREKVLLYLAKSPQAEQLAPGAVLIFAKTPAGIENQGNPFEFDYKRYLQNRNIRHQVYLGETLWIQEKTESAFNPVVIAERIRDHLLDIYKLNGLEGEGLEVLSALTLGYKKSMDPDIRQLFSATGAAHVLAVSGLHVGIIFLFFNLAFGFMRKRNATRVLFLVMAILALWTFAFITGLSPSVKRSALMFSVALVGGNLRRPPNIFNTLALSAFILLAVQPVLVYDVGLQLSFSAVTGIVYFQPKLKSLLHFRYRVFAWLWELLTVSLAAQAATFPLSCYYFNQFPVYFWLSNFFVIPAAFVFILLGILILAASPFAAVAGFLAKGASFLVRLLLAVLQEIGQLPDALVTGFNYTGLSMALSVAILLFVVLFIETRRHGFLMASLMAASLVFISAAVRKVSQNNRQEIIAYRYREPVIHLLHGRDNYLLAPADVLQNDFPIREVGAVSKVFRLREPVQVPFDSDYSDENLTKKGNLLFFGGIVMILQRNNSIRCDRCNPDLVVVCPGSFPKSDFPASVRVISYAALQPRDTEFRAIHSIPVQGALRFRPDIATRHKNY